MTYRLLHWTAYTVASACAGTGVWLCLHNEWGVGLTGLGLAFTLTKLADHAYGWAE